MREIKFRVWDKETGRFIWIGFENCISDTHEDKPQDLRQGRMVLNASWSDNGTRYVFQQYTGIKDCNGVEIYEGDVVNAVAQKDYEEQSTVSDIIFSNDLQFQARMGEFSFGLPLNWGGWESLTVIGNIYQNPEYAK